MSAHDRSYKSLQVITRSMSTRMSEFNKFKEWLMFVMTKIMENYGTERERGDVIDTFVCDDRIALDASIIYIQMKLPAVDVCESRYEHIIIKRPVKDIRYRARSSGLLYNEIMFYRNYAKLISNTPKYHYGHWRSYDDAIIALQEIEEYGYHSYSQKYQQTHVPSLDDTLLAIREIARFHSRGYIMKELQGDTFNTVISQFRESRYKQIKDFERFFKLLAIKVAKYLREFYISHSICKKTQDLLSEVSRIFMFMSRAHEQLFTICHGNLRLDNILINSSDTSRPVMLSNFEYVIHASAVVDLATYICFCGCTTFEMCRFRNILEVYCSQLHMCLKHAGVQNEEKYSFEAFLTEYRKYAIGGLITVCFNLPVITGRVKKDALKEMNEDDYINLIMEDEEDKMCKSVSEMIIHLNTIGCLDNYEEIMALS